MRKVEIRYAGDEEHRRLWTIRGRYGVTWRWMLIEGAKFLKEQDLIGESAPEYLECHENGDQSKPTDPDPDPGDSLVRRVDVPDREIDHIEIDVTLVESASGGDTESDAAQAGIPDTAPDADPDDDGGATGTAESPDSTADQAPADADDTANGVQDAATSVAAPARRFTPVSAPPPPHTEPATTIRRHGFHRTPALPRDRTPAPGGANDA